MSDSEVPQSRWAAATTGRAVLRTAGVSQRKFVLGGAALLMLWQTCESLVPVMIGIVIDRAVSTGDVGAIVLWVALLGVLFLVLSFAGRWGGRLEVRAVEQASHQARVAVAAAALDPRSRPDPSRRTGTVLSIASNDTDRVAGINGVIPVGASAVTSLLVAAVALLNISVPLGLVVLLGVPPLLWVVQALGKPLERRAGAEQAHAAEATSIATDLILGLRVLKGIGGERPALDRYRAASRRSLTATLRSATSESIVVGVTSTLTLCFLAVVALIGGRFAAEGRITVGELVAAVGLAQFLIGPFAALGYAGATLAKARASAGRVATALGVVRTAVPVVAESVGRSGLTVHTDEVSLTVGPTELVGFAADPARSAALVQALTLARHDDAGQVQIDGVPVAQLDPALAAARLLVETHDAQLFHSPLRENLVTTAGSAARVGAALIAADADQVVETLPDGLDTVLMERGRSLSGGQRQRIALARALAADPEVLVLHDPTTAVDTATEERIAAGLVDIRGGRSTLIVSTSPTLLSHCGRVVFVDADGRLVDSTHHALVASSADYRQMVLG